MKSQEEIQQISNLMIEENTPYGGCGTNFKQKKPYASVIWSNGGGWDIMFPYARLSDHTRRRGTKCAS